MDDDSSSPLPDSSGHIRIVRAGAPLLAGAAMVCALLYAGLAGSQPHTGEASVSGWAALATILDPTIMMLIGVLVLMSAFFSASEVAFFSIHQVRLRAMGESSRLSERLVASMMTYPGRLLTTILVGNMIMNVLISVLLPRSVARIFGEAAGLPPSLSLPLTAIVCTGFLVFFGEITPKIIAVRISEAFARSVALPLRGLDIVLGPVCWILLRFTDLVFSVTRFNEIKAAPFITDEEFKSLLTRGEAEGVLEGEEGQMIQGILELGDARLREILVPRPDVISIALDATVREALELFREHEFSRMPVFDANLDHVTGMLVAKDLLPYATKGLFDERIARVIRRAHFVPETMSIAAFVKHAQRVKTHLAIVVDEYGGTEGIVTLEDALEEVVGEIRDESDDEETPYTRISANAFRVDGNLPLDELSELIGVQFEDEEHETIAGFLMAQTSKVLHTGDTIRYNRAGFLVEKMEGKRVSQLRVEVGPGAEDGDE